LVATNRLRGTDGTPGSRGVAGAFSTGGADSWPGTGPRVFSGTFDSRLARVSSRLPRPDLLRAICVLLCGCDNRSRRGAPRGGEYRAHDLRIRPAAAQVPAHPTDDIRFGRGRDPSQERDRGQNLSWRAEAALRSIMLDERSLH